MAKRQMCKRVGKDLKPCWVMDEWGLGEALAGERPKGMRPLVTFDLETGKDHFFAIVYAPKSGTKLSKTLTLNYCPWCGENIAPPDSEKKSAPKKSASKRKKKSKSRSKGTGNPLAGSSVMGVQPTGGGQGSYLSRQQGDPTRDWS